MAKPKDVEFVPTNWGLARTCADGMKFDTHNNEPSLTDQSGAEAADINVIMATYTRTGYLPNNNRQPQWGDFTEAPINLQDAIDLVEKADQAFMSLPANIRAMAGNDPVTFLAMLEDEGALEALRQAGFDQAPGNVTPPDTKGNPPTQAASPPANGGVTQTN